MKLRGVACALAVVLGTSTGRAQPESIAQSKEYFRAGATAYAAGDYLVAIQALEKAYALTPLPAIAFSLAQAERRQYFASRDARHLTRAVELYRSYLRDVPTGGRRVDATDALTQLEPLLARTRALGPETEKEVVPEPKTRLMVSSEAPSAAIALDGNKPVGSPLIAEVTPGPHVLRVEAQGYFPAERRVVAVQGELVPVEVPLRERPSVVFVNAPASADLYVDGAFVGQVYDAQRLELTSGRHVFNFAMTGRRVTTIEVDLERGGTHHVRATLEPTSQRVAARALIVTSGAALAGGIVLSALAIHRENDAEAIIGKKSGVNISSRELDSYEEAIEMRGRLRAAAIGSFSVSAAALLTGLFLHELDTPTLKDAFRPKNSEDPARSAPLAGVRGGAGELGVELGMTF